jgi:hypothetical protein
MTKRQFLIFISALLALMGRVAVIADAEMMLGFEPAEIATAQLAQGTVLDHALVAARGATLRASTLNAPAPK